MYSESEAPQSEDVQKLSLPQPTSLASAAELPHHGGMSGDNCTSTSRYFTPNV